MKGSIEIDLLVDMRALVIVGWELHATVETEASVVFVVVRQGGTKVDGPNSGSLTVLPPQVHAVQWIWEVLWLVHDQERRAVMPNVAWVLEEWNDALYEVQVVLREILLTQQDFMIHSIPSPCPMLVRPAETERMSLSGSQSMSSRGRFKMRVPENQ